MLPVVCMACEKRLFTPGALWVYDSNIYTMMMSYVKDMYVMTSYIILHIIFQVRGKRKSAGTQFTFNRNLHHSPT